MFSVHSTRVSPASPPPSGPRPIVAEQSSGFRITLRSTVSVLHVASWKVRQYEGQGQAYGVPCATGP